MLFWRCSRRPRSRSCARSSAGICAAVPAMARSSRPHSRLPPCYGRNLMLDLGTSFVASVSRDPKALAIVDGDVRLTYEAWYRTISAVVAGFDALGLRPGNHLVTVLQNRWEAATVHWACQFAGIIVTPINWRATGDEIDYALENSQAKGIVFEASSAPGVAES